MRAVGLVADHEWYSKKESHMMLFRIKASYEMLFKHALEARDRVRERPVKLRVRGRPRRLSEEPPGMLLRCCGWSG